MKKEKLTLKKLNAQLELLLKNSTPQNPTVDKGVTTSIINTLSSSYTGVNSKVSSILVSLKKLPIIGKLIKFLKLDKLTFWGIFVLGRKLFIFFNAFLGIYFMLKFTGISFEAYEGINSIIAGVIGLSYNYLEVVKSFTSKALHSTLEFFNYKIIDNSPPPSGIIDKTGHVSQADNNSWFDINQWTSGGRNNNLPTQTTVQDISISRPSSVIDQIEEKTFSLRKTYMEGQDQSLPTNSSSPWYKDINTWYYIIGGVVVTVSIVGLGYIAYSYYLSLYYPDVSPPSPSTETGKGLDNNLDNDLPASPSSDTSTIRPPIKKPRGMPLPPINTEDLPPVPKVETPLNPWTTPSGWRRPALTPIQEVGVRPGFTNPLSPEKVTVTDPKVISGLPPTPTAGPTKQQSNLEDFIDSLDL